MASGRIKVHTKSGYGVPMAHTCKDGDMESTKNCPACEWLRTKADGRMTLEEKMEYVEECLGGYKTQYHEEAEQ